MQNFLRERVPQQPVRRVDRSIKSGDILFETKKYSSYAIGMAKMTDE